MSDVDILTRQLIANPHDRFLARVLADALAEELPRGYPDACRAVARIRRAEKSAAEIAEAVIYSERINAWKNDAGATIRAYLRLPASPPLSLTIVAGSRPPALVTTHRLPGFRYVVGFDVTVGARWVISRVWNVREMWINRPDAVPAADGAKSAEVTRARAWQSAEERYHPTQEVSK